MSSNTPNVAYYAIIVVLMLSSLFAMRLPVGKALKMAFAWVAIFGVAFLLFAFRGEFSSFGQRLRAEATGAPIESRGEVRIPIGQDGHFWVDAAINGHSTHFLIDSGATTTTISRTAAEQAAVPLTGQLVPVSTANGVAPMRLATADRLQLGSIERTDFAVNVSDRDDTNVLGMNFLSSLSGWRVEEHDLVLRP
jgi:aspartyl protease family protein